VQNKWPYTYDSCDVGTVANQTVNGQPEAATVGGDKYHEDILSFLPGQRLSRCTCAGEDHPGPKHPDGSFVGRSAPEIDVFEAQIRGDPLSGQVSQSAQWAVSANRYRFVQELRFLTFWNDSRLMLVIYGITHHKMRSSWTRR
jgi:beta-glucanase (GH16 family)